MNVETPRPLPVLRRAVGALLVSLLAVFALPVTPAVAADVTVFAAASLKEALDAQVKAFEAATGHKSAVSYAGSNALAKQIEGGAPADLFISADLAWMDYLAERKLIKPDTRSNLLNNSLVLIAPASSTATVKIGPGFALAQALGGGKLAMANPDSVPAGKYGKTALESLGVWPSVEKSVARAENVRAALALVSRGEAPFGIVYSTDAFADKGVRIADTFPAGSHPAIVYPAALTASSTSPAAKPLLDFLRGKEAAATWEKYGFKLAQ